MSTTNRLKLVPCCARQVLCLLLNGNIGQVPDVKKHDGQTLQRCAPRQHGFCISYYDCICLTTTARAHEDVVNLRDVCAVLFHLGLGMSSFAYCEGGENIILLGQRHKSGKNRRGTNTPGPWIAIWLHIHQSNPLCCEEFNGARECNDAVLQRIPFEGT